MEQTRYRDLKYNISNNAFKSYLECFIRRPYLTAIWNPQSC